MSKMDEFLMRRCIKDLHSIRKKGILLEEIKSFLRKKYHLVHVGGHHSKSLEYYELYYEGDNGVRVTWAYTMTGMGIPSLVISMKTKEEWLSLREELRKVNLVR